MFADLATTLVGIRLAGPPALAGLVAVLALTVLNNLYVLGKLLLRG